MTQAQNEQLPVQHFDKIRHHCPIIAKSFLAFTPDFCKIVTDEKRTEIKKYFADHPNDWERFCNTPVVIPPAVSSIWMNLSDDQEETVLQTLKELPKCFSRTELDQQFEQRGLLDVVTNPPASHMLSLRCNPWEVGANADLLYFSPELKRVEIKK